MKMRPLSGLLGGYNFRGELYQKLKQLYIEDALSRGEHPREISDSLAFNGKLLGDAVLSQAARFWEEGEERLPSGYKAHLPWVPNLIEEFGTIRKERHLSYALSESERTIVPEERPVTQFISDPKKAVKGYLDVNGKRNGPFSVWDGLCCDGNIIRLFRHIESIGRMHYCPHHDNFGFDALYLDPSQVAQLLTSDNEDMQRIKFDPDDMLIFGAACLGVMGVPTFRGRLAMDGEKRGRKPGHLALYVLGDGLAQWRAIVLNPDYPRFGPFSKMWMLPILGSRNDPMRDREITLSYNAGKGFQGFKGRRREEEFSKFVENLTVESIREEVPV
jgi:hypothetical protein